MCNPHECLCKRVNAQASPFYSNAKSGSVIVTTETKREIVFILLFSFLSQGIHKALQSGCVTVHSREGLSDNHCTVSVAWEGLVLHVSSIIMQGTAHEYVAL